MIRITDLQNDDGTLTLIAWNETSPTSVVGLHFGEVISAFNLQSVGDGASVLALLRHIKQIGKILSKPVIFVVSEDNVNARRLEKMYLRFGAKKKFTQYEVIN